MLFIAENQEVCIATTEQTPQEMHATKDRFGLKSPFAALHHVALIMNEINEGG